jgi:hypothetical protein
MWPSVTANSGVRLIERSVPRILLRPWFCAHFLCVFARFYEDDGIKELAETDAADAGENRDAYRILAGEPEEEAPAEN